MNSYSKRKIFVNKNHFFVSKCASVPICASVPCPDFCPLCKNVWICVHGKNVQMFVAQNWNVCMLFTDYLVVDPRSGSIRRVYLIITLNHSMWYYLCIFQLSIHSFICVCVLMHCTFGNVGNFIQASPFITLIN